MSDKREQLIQTALLLFYQYGIRAIGINEVLKQSGIAKKTKAHFRVDGMVTGWHGYL